MARFYGYIGNIEGAFQREVDMRRTDEGFRYVRSYRVSGCRDWRWALRERRDGRMRRVGTAVTEIEYRDFLAGRV